MADNNDQAAVDKVAADKAAADKAAADQVAKDAAEKAAKEAADKAAKEAADKAAADAAAKPAVVPDYKDLKLPKDSTLQAGFLEGIVAKSKALGLSNEEAQLLVDHEVAVEEARIKAQNDEREKTVAKWVDEIQKDKEIGGAEFPKNSELSKRVVMKFFPEIKEELDKTGLGNHPGLMRGLVRIGKLMSEDVLSGTNGDPAGTGRKSDSDVFYPTKTA